jgi:hypothetical protein
VLSRFLTRLILVAGIVAGAGVARAQPVPAPAIELAVNRGAAKVADLVGRKVRLQAAKRDLQRIYSAQLAEIDRLKRGRAGWNRDRQIAGKKASSQETAEKLSRTDAALRTLDKNLLDWRAYLLTQVSRELAGTTTPVRRRALEKMRRELATLIRPPARKIILPDDSLDELADPDELAEQIALIEQAERELQRERARLKSREESYARVDRLRTQHDRAGQMSDLDDTDVRRTTGRPETSRTGDASGGAQDEADTDDSGAEPAPADPGSGGGAGDGSLDESPSTGSDSDFVQSSIILADVVDSSTVDALKRAAGSSAKARASAASQARKQVDARLGRLARSRLIIQQHLAKLRRR